MRLLRLHTPHALASTPKTATPPIPISQHTHNPSFKTVDTFDPQDFGEQPSQRMATVLVYLSGERVMDGMMMGGDGDWGGDGDGGGVDVAAVRPPAAIF